MNDVKQLSVPPNKIGQTTGTLATYRKAPSSDRNFVMEEKGTGELAQLGFDSDLGLPSTK